MSPACCDCWMTVPGCILKCSIIERNHTDHSIVSPCGRLLNVLSHLLLTLLVVDSWGRRKRMKLIIS